MVHAKLWKRILNQGVNCNSPEVGGEFLEKLGEKIIKAKIIVDSRTRDSLAEEGKQFQWDRYTRIAFPFNEIWIEGDASIVGLFGALVTLVGIQEFNAGRITGNATAPENAAFAVSIIHISADANTSPWLLGNAVLFLDRERNLITKFLKEAKIHFMVPANIAASMSQERLAQCALSETENIIDPLLLLSCKNVSLKPNDNDPQQVRRAIKRHGGTPDSYRYHTLIVRPPGARSDTPGQDIGVMPCHVCRGHFAEYGPEFGKGLLFGKYAGRFFVPPCVKGKKENGIVEKDYEIRPTNPTNEATHV